MAIAFIIPGFFRIGFLNFFQFEFFVGHIVEFEHFSGNEERPVESACVEERVCVIILFEVIFHFL